MSAGPGRIMRSIALIVDEEREDAHTIDELCARVYVGEIIEKKHRVAAIRAMKNVVAQNKELRLGAAGSRGSPLIIFRPCELLSYAMFRLLHTYGPYKSKAVLRATIQPGGTNYHWTQPGGAWEREVQLAIAERDADHKAAHRIRESIDAELAQFMSLAREIASSLASRRRAL